MKNKKLLAAIGAIALTGSVAFLSFQKPIEVMAEEEPSVSSVVEEPASEEDSWKEKIEEGIAKANELYNNITNYTIGGIAVGTILAGAISVLLSYFLDKRGINKTLSLTGEVKKANETGNELVAKANDSLLNAKEELGKYEEKLLKAVAVMEEMAKNGAQLEKQVGKLADENVDLNAKVAQLEEILKEVLKNDPDYVASGLYEKIYGGK